MTPGRGRIPVAPQRAMVPRSTLSATASRSVMVLLLAWILPLLGGAPPPAAAAWADATSLLLPVAAGEDYRVTTIAGDGHAGYVNGIGTAAEFHDDLRLAIGAGGELYVIDVGNAAIRKVSPTGVVSTFAGGGPPGYVDGVGTGARFMNPSGIAIDAAGNLYVTEAIDANRIRKITPSGVVSTFAGSTVLGITIGGVDSNEGFVDGIGTAARFAQPTGIAIDPAGNLLVADSGNHAIRRVTPSGVVTTVAGSGVAGYANGPAASARFSSPYDLAADPSGVIYIADTFNNRIRRIGLDGIVSTYAGSGAYDVTDGPRATAAIARPRAIELLPDGSFTLAAQGIRQIRADGMVESIWVHFDPGSADGPVAVARYRGITDLARSPDGGWILADSGQHLIRKLIRSW